MIDATRLVLIPSYNTGPKLIETVREARSAWASVWVVLDGSTDGSAALLSAAFAEGPALRVFELPENRGKGAAVLHGLRIAEEAGFTHVLTMDADGQHPAACIPAFMEASRANPGALILGLPVFGDDAPLLRVRGRRISNWWAELETLRAGIGDSLFGFRVYPVAALRGVMERTRWMRGFDFDPEAAIRLCWQGFRPVNIPAPVRYWRPEEGGVSHFRYGRDNLLLTAMHIRLMLGMLARLPWLLWRRPRHHARREGPPNPVTRSS